MSRVFLQKVETMELLGLCCASQINNRRLQPPEAAQLRLACRENGVVFEAENDERLHSQITLNRNLRRPQDGWTVSKEWLDSVPHRHFIEEYIPLQATQ